MTKPSTITQWLMQPARISEKERKEAATLLKTYPYLVPLRYIEAAEHHKRQPYAPAMMNSIMLNMGNWILFQEFIQSAKSATMPVTETAPADDVFENDEVLTEPLAEEPVSETEYEEEELLADDDLEDFEVEDDGDTDFDTDDEDMVDEEDEKLEYDYHEPIENVIAKVTEEVKAKPEPKPSPVPEVKVETKKEEAKAEPVAMKEEPKTEPAAEAEQPKPTPQPAPKNKKDDGLIQPLYTEDYFLHQGIPVSEKIPGEAEVPQQSQKAKSLMVVMSFSEWLIHFKTKGEREKEEQEDQKALKTMWQKEKLAAALEEENEEIPENVFEMAVNSIAKEEDLASESLAEILIKQGKHGKAIDMYRKLSLRNPQKSAYFARKIEGLQKEKES